MAREYQEHDGAVDANSLFVQYDYEDGATGGVAKYVRLDEVVYPDGNRTVDYDYGTTGAIDDIMSRLASIGDGTDYYASYKYLGAGRIVEEDFTEVLQGIPARSRDELTELPSTDPIERIVPPAMPAQASGTPPECVPDCSVPNYLTGGVPV